MVKKFIFVVLVLCALVTVAIADVDISGMSYDELKALKAKVEEAIYTIDTTECTMVELSSGKTKPIKTGLVNYAAEVMDIAKDYAEMYANDIDQRKDRCLLCQSNVDLVMLDYYSFNERTLDMYIGFYMKDVYAKIEDILK